MFEIFVRQCVVRPAYNHLQSAYADFKANSRPCQRGATNQCAIRMSIALARAGFGLESFEPRGRVHDGGNRCRTEGIAHVLGANELARFLRQALFEPRYFRPAAGARGCGGAFDDVRGAKGILYFSNCFTRDGEGAAQGDHIDLFDGFRYYNQVIRPKAGGDETSGGSLFGRADEVRFWDLG